MANVLRSAFSTINNNISGIINTTNMSGIHGNASWVWGSKGETFSVSRRAKVVLSQPVAVLSLALCLLSLLANSLSITATLLGPNGLVTHLKLVVSLALSDMLLSLSTLSNLLHRIFNPVPTMSSPPAERLTFACVTTFQFALNTAAVVVSLLNLLVMALDHYVAIMNPLHYPTRLSRTNGNIIVCFVWFLAFLAGGSVFLADVSEFRRLSFFVNYCEYVRMTDYQGEYLVFAVAFLTLFVVVYAYGRIYVEVRRTYRNGSTNRLDYARNRKALLTTLLIIGTFAFCWLPTCLYQIALIIQVRVDDTKVAQHYAALLTANRYLNALLLLNSLCDPLIYAFRLRDVQLGYRRLFQKCFLLGLCCCRHHNRHHRQNHQGTTQSYYYSSFRSSSNSMRKTQVVHLPAVVDSAPPAQCHHHHQRPEDRRGSSRRMRSSEQVSPQGTTSLSLLALEGGGGQGLNEAAERRRAGAGEVTPMIVYSVASPRSSSSQESPLRNRGDGSSVANATAAAATTTTTAAATNSTTTTAATMDEEGEERGGHVWLKSRSDETSECDETSGYDVNGRLLADVLCRSCDVDSCLSEKMSCV